MPVFRKRYGSGRKVWRYQFSRPGSDRSHRQFVMKAGFVSRRAVLNAEAKHRAQLSTGTIQMNHSKMTMISSGHGSKIGNKMEPAIAAILSHDSIEAAAKATGVSANTLLRWMKEPKFEAALSAARFTMFQYAMGRLQNAATDAAEMLIGLMKDKKSPLTVRLNAAQMILQHAKRAAKAEDLEGRIKDLERKLAARR
jgi:hypothetical protein